MLYRKKYEVFQNVHGDFYGRNREASDVTPFNIGSFFTDKTVVND